MFSFRVQGMEPIDIARDIQASMPLESPKAPFVGSPSAGHPISAPSEPATSTAVDTSANPAAGFAENVSRVSDHSIYDSTCAQQSDGDWQPQITVPQLRLQPSTRQHWRSADQADGKPAVFRAQMQPSGDLDGDAGRDGDVTGREGEVSFSGRLRRGSCGGLAPASSCGSDPGSRGRLDKKVNLASIMQACFFTSTLHHITIPTLVYNRFMHAGASCVHGSKCQPGGHLLHDE